MRDLMWQYPVLSTTLICFSFAAVGAAFFLLVRSMVGPSYDD